MRVVLAKHIPYYARRFNMPRRRIQTKLVHRVENAALHRLLPVGNIRQGAAHHHAHRIFEIAPLRKLGQRQRLVLGCGAVVTTRRQAGRRCGRCDLRNFGFE